MRLIPAQIRAVAAAFDGLPGVGPRAAMRFARHLLAHHGEGEGLVQALQGALTEVALCADCRSYTVNSECAFCQHWQTLDNRQTRCLVVEQPEHLQQALDAGWSGTAFVLHGLLSPLDGQGPLQLGLDRLDQLLRAEQPPAALIVALDSSVEGRTTAHYLSTLARRADVDCQAPGWDVWLEQAAGSLPDPEEKS